MPPRRSCFALCVGSILLTEPWFQCHHGVPASGDLGPDPGDRDIRFNATTAFLLPPVVAALIILAASVSMPPRRSCFLAPAEALLLVGQVSMPPRLSCFNSSQRYTRRSSSRFNATTAFLLPIPVQQDLLDDVKFQCHHGVPASAGGPPRREAQGDAFQWHHGVPASFYSHEDREALIRVSMPPRRSCFIGRTTGGGAGELPFQCHHGVPASGPGGLGPPGPGSPFQCHHGVPASWSWTPPGGRTSSCFNATTAFLLPPEGASSIVGRKVSMPPRRSCFLRLPGWLLCYATGFNATTAFLLLISGNQLGHPATVFQCHHGVPASLMEAMTPQPPLLPFQCHHGVPASAMSRSTQGTM